MFVVFWEWVFLRRRLVLLFIDIMFMIFRVMSKKDWLSCAIRLYIQSFQSSEIINWSSGALYAFPFQKTKVVIWALFPYLHLLCLFVCLSWLHHWDCNDGQRRVLLSCLKLDRTFVLCRKSAWWQHCSFEAQNGHVTSCGRLGSNKSSMLLFTWNEKWMNKIKNCFQYFNAPRWLCSPFSF